MTREAMNAVTRLIASHDQRFFAQAGLRKELALAAGADEIDDLVDGHPADELALLVDDRGRDQVVALEGLGGFLRLVARLHRHDVGHHDLRHRVLELRDDQPRERQHAFEALVAVDHEDLVGVVRQGVEAAQVPRHGVDPRILAHALHVEVHERAGRVLRVGHRRAQLLAFLDRQRLEDVPDDLIG
jgi:hypothetical protein